MASIAFHKSDYRIKSLFTNHYIINTQEGYIGCWGYADGECTLANNYKSLTQIPI